MRRVSSIGGDIRYFDRYRGRISRGGPARIISPVQIFKMLFILLTSPRTALLRRIARARAAEVAASAVGIIAVASSHLAVYYLPAKLRHDPSSLTWITVPRIQVANLIADTPRTLKSPSSRPFEAANPTYVRRSAHLVASFSLASLPRSRCRIRYRLARTLNAT